MPDHPATIADALVRRASSALASVPVGGVAVVEGVRVRRIHEETP